jgi:hypothetical protein
MEAATKREMLHGLGPDRAALRGAGIKKLPANSLQSREFGARSPARVGPIASRLTIRQDCWKQP